MTIGGWIFLLASWAAIICLCGYCFRQIFRIREENIVYPLEVETKLEEDQSNTNSKE